VQVRQATIESRQLPVASSRELSKVGIRHLPVTDHTAKLQISERDTVRLPELMVVSSLDCADDSLRSHRRLAGP